MPETPDFDQIARQFFDDYVGYVDDPTATLAAVAEQLRLVWNARGAADQATIDALQARVKALDAKIADLDMQIGLLENDALEQGEWE